MCTRTARSCFRKASLEGRYGGLLETDQRSIGPHVPAARVAVLPKRNVVRCAVTFEEDGAEAFPRFAYSSVAVCCDASFAVAVAPAPCLGCGTRHRLPLFAGFVRRSRGFGSRFGCSVSGAVVPPPLRRAPSSRIAAPQAVPPSSQTRICTAKSFAVPEADQLCCVGARPAGTARLWSKPRRGLRANPVSNVCGARGAVPPHATRRCRTTGALRIRGAARPGRPDVGVVASENGQATVTTEKRPQDLRAL